MKRIIGLALAALALAAAITAGAPASTDVSHDMKAPAVVLADGDLYHDMGTSTAPASPDLYHDM